MQIGSAAGCTGDELPAKEERHKCVATKTSAPWVGLTRLTAYWIVLRGSLLLHVGYCTTLCVVQATRGCVPIGQFVQCSTAHCERPIARHLRDVRASRAERRGCANQARPTRLSPVRLWQVLLILRESFLLVFLQVVDKSCYLQQFMHCAAFQRWMIRASYKHCQLRHIACVAVFWVSSCSVGFFVLVILHARLKCDCVPLMSQLSALI